MPQINTPDIKSEAITGPKLSNTVAIPSGATCATAGPGDNDTSLASTAFVQQEITSNATYFSDTFTGTGTVLDPIDIDASLFAVTAGTYTPTLNNTTNIASTTPAVCHYFKIGSQVTVIGSFTVATTLGVNTASTVGISLPIASNFAVTTDASGLGQSPGEITGGPNSVYIQGNVAGDRLEVNFLSGGTSSNLIFFSATYTVI